MTLAQEMTLAQGLRTLAQDTTVCCNIGRKCLSMSLIQNTNGFQTRFQTQMATPLAQAMTLAQEMTLAQANLAQDTTVCCNIGTRFQTQLATPPALVMNLAQDTTVCCNIGLKFLAMRLIQNTNGFQTQMATPPAQENLAQEMTLAQ